MEGTKTRARGLHGLLLLAILFSLRADAATKNWVGGGGADTKWTTGANWQGGAPPSPGDDLQFTGASIPVTTLNDFPASTPFNNITIGSFGGGSWLIQGNRIQLTGAITVGGFGNVLETPFTLLAALNLTVDAASIANFAGSIDGGFGLVKKGPGIVFLSGLTSNTYSGGTVVEDGSIRPQKSGGAIAIPGTLFLGDGVGAAGSAAVILGANEQIQDLASVSMASDGLLDLNNHPETIGALAGSGAVDLGSATLVTGGNDGTSTYSGDIGGTGGVTKIGLGTFTYLGTTDNPYTGLTTVANGVLELNKSFIGASSFHGPVQIGDGSGAAGSAVLRFLTSFALPAATKVTTLADGRLDMNGFDNFFGSLAGPGQVTLGTGSITVGFDGTSTAFSGVLSGTGAFKKAGPGTLTLGGAASNTITGTVTVVSGVLELGKTGGAKSLAGPLVVGTGVGAANSARLRCVADENITGFFGVAIDVDGVFDVNGTVQLNGIGPISGTGNLSLGANGSLFFGMVTPATLSGVISGTGSMVKTGSGVFTIAGAASNTFTGSTGVIGPIVLAKTGGAIAVAGSFFTVGTAPGFPGSAVLASGEQIANGALVKVGDASLLDLGNQIETVANVTGTGTISVGTGELIVGGTNAAATFDGVITVAPLGRVTKVGTGTFTLTGNSPTATTRIDAGALRVIGTVGAINGNGGTLMGTGTTGPVSMFSGSLSPGASPGILAASGNVSFQAASSFVVELNGLTAGNGANDHDKLLANGNVSLGNANLVASVGFPVVAGNTFIVIECAGTVTGSLAQGSSVTIGNRSYAISINPSNQLRLVAQPATFTWSGAGADNGWTTPANWVGGVAPGPGDNLVFPQVAARKANVNDFPAGTVFNSVALNGTDYVITGNGFNLGDNGLTANVPAGVAPIVNVPIGLTTATIFTTIGASSYTLNGAISLNGALVFDGPGFHILGGPISGPGLLRQQGSGTAILAGNNTFTGPTQIFAGVVDVQHGNALGATGAGNGTQVAATATLRIGASMTLPEAVEVNGFGPGGGSAALTVASSSIAQLTGLLTVGSQAAVLVPATAQLILRGGLADKAGTPELIKLGGGRLDLETTPCTHAGMTTVNGGILQAGTSLVGPVTLNGSSSLLGTGPVGTIAAVSGTVAPGNNVGTLLVAGNVTLSPGATYTVDAFDAVANYDQLKVDGDVAAGGTLGLVLNFVPAFGSVLRIIDNKSPNPTTGTFAGRPEGSVFLVGATVFRISYAGGTGNDVTLTAVDPATLSSVSIQPAEILEGNAGVTRMLFNVVLSAPNLLPVTMNFATVDGTAKANEDYKPASGSLTFTPGETFKTVPVDVFGDTQVEADETFKLRLTNIVNASPVQAEGVGTVLNDDLPSLSIGSAAVTEGNSGTTSATFPVTLSQAAAKVVTVSYATANGSATAPDDYTATSGTLTFAIGETSKTITVSVKGDVVAEADETFTVTLSSPSNAALGAAVGTGTIQNDDSAVLSVASVQAAEGNSGTSPMTFTVTLSPASAQSVTVTYATSDGTAKAPEDYQAASGTLTFAPGETTKLVAVSLMGDTAFEPNETFTLTLSNATNATLANAVATGTIANDDQAAAGCSDGSATTLCLLDQRFRATVSWKNPYDGGSTGIGTPARLTDTTGTFWFFNSANIELVFKMLDGRATNGKFWVLLGSLTDVEFTVTITDTVTGSVKTYHNAPKTLGSFIDVNAFAPSARATEEALSTGALARGIERIGLDGLSIADLSVALPATSADALVAGCAAGPGTLCLTGGRFQVSVGWKNPYAGTTGTGKAVTLTSDSGYFWFFDAANVELVVKVLDGRSTNGKFWVLFGALSDVEYTVTVTDSQTGATKSYVNAPGKISSLIDLGAF